LKRYHETTALQIILFHIFAWGKYVHAPAVLTALQKITIVIYYYDIEERRQE